MKNLKIVILIVVILLIAAVAYFGSAGQSNQIPVSAGLEPQINEDGGVSVKVSPVSFEFDKPVKFEIVFNTHQGDLDFDLIKISVLIDDHGKQYSPIEWQGGFGGHHLSGALIFPAISKEVKTMKLVIADIYGVKERIFEWSLEN